MEKCSLGQKRDIISYLPDPIRSHIISFLPMKEAMRACVLSRQWEHVCSSLSNLEFSQRDFIYKKKYMVDDFKNFVDELIFRHDGSDIRRFSLRIDLINASLSSRRVNAWISFAIRHNVQDFELIMPNRKEKLEKLPLCLFVCNTLTRLHLLSIKMEWPKNIKFPVLKSFTCESISFRGENLGNKLLSSGEFPVLEELEFTWCSLNVTTLSITIPTLKCFKIVDGNYTEISVSNSALEEIDYCGPDPPKISSESLSSLSCATFQFGHYFESEGEIATYSNFSCARKFLMGLQNVVRLHLMCGFLEFLSKDRDLLASLPSWCRGPKHLILQMLKDGVHNQVITLLLESFHDLEIVEIYVATEHELKENGISSGIKMEGDWQKKGLPPVNAFNHLRTVTVKFFGGGMQELDMVRYFIDNAKGLEEMKIVREKEKVGESTMTDAIQSIVRELSPNVKLSVS